MTPHEQPPARDDRGCAAEFDASPGAAIVRGEGPMTTASPVDQAREALERQAWREAYTLLTSADRETPLEARGP